MEIKTVTAAGPPVGNDILAAFGVPAETALAVDNAEEAETFETVMWLFNPWHDIPNLNGDGFMFGVRYSVLERLRPISIPVYPVAVIKPRSGLNLGFDGLGGPIAKVGSNVESRNQMPSESITRLLSAYYAVGCTALRSITSHTVAQRRESLTIFAAVLWQQGEDGRAGVDLVLEELHGFLKKGEALRRLKAADRDGFLFQGARYELPEGGYLKGVSLIAELLDGVERAVDFALNESTGVLPTTRRQLIGVSKNLSGNKGDTDRLDDWALVQFPSFSMDSELDRAKNALTHALKANQKGGGLSDGQPAGGFEHYEAIIERQSRQIEELREDNRETKADLRKLMESTQTLLATISAGVTAPAVLTQAAPEPPTPQAATPPADGPPSRAKPGAAAAK